jgi:hypothetical protein
MVGAGADLFPCTAFVVKKGDKVFAGNNEDYIHPLTRMWFIPGTEKTYGRVYFGYDNMAPQGGMNEKGLFYDGFWVPEEAVDPEDKPVVPDDIYDRVMAECADVAEALRMIKEYKLHYEIQGMLIYGDAAGNGIIIGGGDIVTKEADHLASTNFYQARTPKEDIDCWRFKKADEMLRNADEVSVDFCRRVLEAVSMEITQYSIVYDLSQRHFFLYHYHNFDDVRSFNLDEELKKGARVYDIPALFPENPRFLERYRNMNRITPLNTGAVLIFLIAAGVLFALVPLLFGLARLTLKEPKGNPLRKRIRFTHFFLSAASWLTLLELLMFIRFPHVFTAGIPPTLEGIPPTRIALLHLPHLIVLLTLILIFMLIRVFRRQLWNRFLRIYTLMMTALLSVLMGLFFYWEFIRMYI